MEMESIGSFQSPCMVMEILPLFVVISAEQPVGICETGWFCGITSVRFTFETKPLTTESAR